MLAVKEPSALPSAGTKLSQRLFTVLAALNRAGQPVSLGQLAATTGLPKSTVHRLLRDLQSAGFVERTATESYHLGLELWAYGEKARGQHLLRRFALPQMRRLALETGGMVQCAILHGDQAMVLERIMGNSGIDLPSQVGMSVPLHASALGKMLLAQSPPAMARRVLCAPLPRYTANTCQSPAHLRRQLAVIRERIYAVDQGEIVSDLHCVAVPLDLGDSERAAAVSVSFRNPRWAPTEWLPALVAVSRRITQRYHSPESRHVPDKQHTA
ncbi:IclR family transcriptional regulator [Streptosporangium sp. NPDC051022]|uniref:IclR family transcriptional regulator n=1 Tax=Streptosporangium sp. NPDC051022 TaxID=3155752 RepID=UPI0034290017